MKKLLTILLILIAELVQCQDLFQKSLYSADLVMANREKIVLTDEQAEKIKKIHSQNAGEFSNLKWDLDAATTKLSQLMDEVRVNAVDVQKQMDLVLTLENQLKKKQLQTLVAIKNELTENQQNTLNGIKNNVPKRNLTNIGTDTREGKRNESISVVGRRSSSGENPLYYVISNGKKTKVKDIESINPNNIHSIEVLKDNPAIEKYGEEGKNGVIIVTMKKGS